MKLNSGHILNLLRLGFVAIFVAMTTLLIGEIAANSAGDIKFKMSYVLILVAIGYLGWLLIKHVKKQPYALVLNEEGVVQGDDPKPLYYSDLKEVSITQSKIVLYTSNDSKKLWLDDQSKVDLDQWLSELLARSDDEQLKVIDLR